MNIPSLGDVEQAEKDYNRRLQSDQRSRSTRGDFRGKGDGAKARPEESDEAA